MVQTRAQGANESTHNTASVPAKNTKVSKAAALDHPKATRNPRGTKRQHGEEKMKTTSAQPAAKRAKANPLANLLSKYGTLPLQGVLGDVTSATPKTLLAFLLNALLSSMRISHGLATKTIKYLIKTDYHEIHVLKQSSWEEKTMVLNKGGYTRYREKTATMLDDLVDLVLERYDGDLNNLLTQTGKDPTKIRAALKEIKGVADVGMDTFFDTAQVVWSCLVSFVDLRSIKTVQWLGLGGVSEFWHDVNEDLTKMARLSAALTSVRLEKREQEFL